MVGVHDPATKTADSMSNNALFTFQEEFASALALKPNSDFVENMFALMDSDHNGYISFREFLNSVVLLSKGNVNQILNFSWRFSGSVDFYTNE